MQIVPVDQPPAALRFDKDVAQMQVAMYRAHGRRVERRRRGHSCEARGLCPHPFERLSRYERRNFPARFKLPEVTDKTFDPKVEKRLTQRTWPAGQRRRQLAVLVQEPGNRNKVWDQELGRWLRLDGRHGDANEVTEVNPRKDRRRMVSGREPVPQIKGAPQSSMRPGQLDVDPRNAVT